MNIGEPLRTIIVEPLELPVNAPTVEPKSLNRNRSNLSRSTSRHRYEHPRLRRSNSWIPRLAMELRGMESALCSAQVVQ